MRGTRDTLETSLWRAIGYRYDCLRIFDIKYPCSFYKKELNLEYGILYFKIPDSTAMSNSNSLKPFNIPKHT